MALARAPPDRWASRSPDGDPSIRSGHFMRERGRPERSTAQARAKLTPVMSRVQLHCGLHARHRQQTAQTASPRRTRPWPAGTPRFNAAVATLPSMRPVPSAKSLVSIRARAPRSMAESVIMSPRSAAACLPPAATALLPEPHSSTPRKFGNVPADTGLLAIHNKPGFAHCRRFGRALALLGLAGLHLPHRPMFESRTAGTKKRRRTDPPRPPPREWT